MGFFDKLFNRKKQENNASPELLEMVEVEPGLQVPGAIARHWSELGTARVENVTIKAEVQENMTFRQSKFAHYPCIPKNYAYPKDREGNFMFPLAQINCSELPRIEGFPESGYLQFYIAANEAYGLDFDNIRSQADFRVWYFTEEEVREPEEDFSFLEQTMQWEMTPVYKPHALQFGQSIEYIGMSDVQFFRENGFVIDPITERYPAIQDELEEYMYEHFSGSGHKLGGYAYFTQEDPRINNPDLEHYRLLLQIDSIGDDIMWGDVGVANFFIDPADLARLDFSKVAYNWDCS